VREAEEKQRRSCERSRGEAVREAEEKLRRSCERS
jgi:hypothetical protein